MATPGVGCLLSARVHSVLILLGATICQREWRRAGRATVVLVTQAGVDRLWGPRHRRNVPDGREWTGSLGCFWAMLSGPPSPSSAECRPCRCGLSWPRGPFTTGVMAAHAERLVAGQVGSRIEDEDGFGSYGKSCDEYWDLARRAANRIVNKLNKNIRAQRCAFDAAHLKEISGYQNSWRDLLDQLRRHYGRFLYLGQLGPQVLTMQDYADANFDVLDAMLKLQCHTCQEIAEF